MNNKDRTWNQLKQYEADVKEAKKVLERIFA